MRNCKLHGKFIGNTCQGCIAVQQQEADDRAEANERLERLRDSTPSAKAIAQAMKNSGDYKCPRCFCYTLILNAPTCGNCQKDVSDDYWPPIREELARQKKASEEAAKIEAEARARRDEIQAEADAKAREQAAQVAAREAEGRRLIKERTLFAGIYFGCLVPILTVVGWIFWVRLFRGAPFTNHSDMYLMLVPGFNWVVVLGAVFSVGPEDGGGAGGLCSLVGGWRPCLHPNVGGRSKGWGWWA